MIRRSTLAALTIIVSMFLPCYLAAAPNISSVSGAGMYQTGNTITISGTGFGAHRDYSPSHQYLANYFDDFESGALNRSAGFWDVGDQSGIVLDNGPRNRANSTYCARQERGDTTKKTILGHYGDSTQRQLYIYGWRWFQDFNTVDGTNAKIFRVWSSYSSDYNWVMGVLGPTAWQTGRFGWTIETSHTVAGNVYYGSLGSEFRESWHLYEIFIDRENNLITVWMDGQEKLRASPADWGTFNPYAIIYDRYSHETDSPYTYTDDCYISHTQARVMIGNSPQFSSATHREIQLPLSWTDTSVSIRFNRGSFPSADTVYLYVVDGAGGVNASGYPIQLSGTVTDTTPPARPTGVTVTIEN